MPMTITATDELSSQIAVRGVLNSTAITTDTTVTSVLTLPVPTDSNYKVMTMILGRRTDVANKSWHRQNTATFYNNAGTLAQVGSTTTLSTDGAGGATGYTIAGTNVSVTVNASTGGETWSWKVYLMYF